MIKKSIKHLNKNKMTYCEHFVFAFFHGLKCIKAGFRLMIHSIVPGLFETSGSKLVAELNKVFTERQQKNKDL